MGYQSIYDRLRANGLTEAGALAMLGNWDCESNCESNRVQGDFSPYRTLSKQYTEGVDNGSISKKEFMGDSKGYGLSQWTFWSRKAGLYDFCKQRGGSISSEELQVDYAIEEREMPSEAYGLLDKLKTSNDLYQCTSDVCYKYENPAVKNVDVRFQSANRIKHEIDLNPGPVPPQPEPPGPEPPKPDVFWPPRTIDKNCVGFPEIWVLNAILYCRGYGLTPVDTWMDDTTEAVMQFQRDSGLAADGCVGPMTWNKLLERG